MADWDKLLSRTRLRDPSSQPDQYDKRSSFDSDFDRVVFSSSLRRMQDKTQVFPLESHDFVRTRLTHSTEVAAVGRALGISSARILGDNERLTGDHQRDWSTIIATACLLHDIGNPPFGHSGEKYIGSWFTQKLARADGLDLIPVRTRSGIPLELSDERERNDLTNFEGNAHAFRVATRLQTLGDPFGMNLTSGTLAALLKYPCSSTQSSREDGKKSRAKFGYFKSDQIAFDRVRENVGLPEFRRHPLTFLVEAADDICYSVVDIEDALKKRVLPFEAVVSQLSELPPDIGKEFVDILKSRAARLPTVGYGLADAQQLAFQRFRALAIGKMTAACVKTFCDNFDPILDGKFDSELTEKMDLSPLCSSLKKLASDHVYGSTEVVRVEESGKHVMWALLDLFYDELRTAPKSRLIRSFLPATPSNDTGDSEGISVAYQQAQRVADYVAGMTDTFALSLHRRLTGGALT